MWWEVSSIVGIGEDKSGVECTLGYKGTRLVLFKFSEQVGVWVEIEGYWLKL